MQEVARLREISFYYKFIEKYSCRYEKTKVYYNAKFRVHNVGLLHDGRPEEKSNENEPIKHSITSICILQYSKFFRRSIMSKDVFLFSVLLMVGFSIGKAGHLSRPVFLRNFF